jgi:acylphosphatase
VFFRDTTQRLATQLGLTGWVRNEPDGSVGVEAQGPPEQVDEFVRWLAVGPRRARVVDLQLTEVDPVDSESEFVVTWVS